MWTMAGCPGETLKDLVFLIDHTMAYQGLNPTMSMFNYRDGDNGVKPSAHGDSLTSVYDHSLKS